MIDKKKALEIVKDDGLKLEDLPDHFKKDQEIVLEAVKEIGWALEFADETLKKDKVFFLKAVKQSGLALEFADETLKKDKEIVFEAVKRSGSVLQFADETLQKDKAFVLKLVKEWGLALEFADETLKKDKEIVLEAVKQWGGALEFADDSLKKDSDIIKALNKDSAKALESKKDNINEMTSTSKYIVQNYHKKSVELHKCYSKDGKKLIYLMGWRWGSWIVTTSDGKPPVFKFDYVPGGNDRKDSINMDNCLINNIKEVKLNGLYDHWYNEVLLRDEFSKEEIEGIERIREENPLVSELIVKGAEEMQSKLYDEGPSLVFDNNGWKNYTSDSWIWGPILIEAKNGYRKIIIADENGNVSDFKADPEKIKPFFSDENRNVLKF